MGRDERAAGLLNIEVVYCPAPGQTQTVRLQLPQGAVLADAWRLCGLAGALTETPPAAGIWGRVQAPGTRLRDGDRVEIYRPLQVDPKEARRLRYKRRRQQR